MVHEALCHLLFGFFEFFFLRNFPGLTPKKEFVGRYFVLNDLVNKTSPDYRGSTQQIIFKLAADGVIDKERVRFGKTKVFFRTGEAAKIESLREQKVGAMITAIQAIARAYVNRKMYAALRAQKEGLKVIQRAIRQFLTLSKVKFFFFLGCYCACASSTWMSSPSLL